MIYKKESALSKFIITFVYLSINSFIYHLHKKEKNITNLFISKTLESFFDQNKKPPLSGASRLEIL